ncbi:hypothetical protein WJX84_004071, partial [Apatococcus fuscideae]
ISARLQVLQQQAMPPPSTGLRSSSRAAGPATATRTTRKRAAAAAAATAVAPSQAPVQQAQPAAPSDVQATPAVLHPAHASTSGAPPTVLRGPQLGEVFYSKNGSPLGFFEQDVASKRGMLMTPLVGGGGVPSTAMHPATLAVGGQATATMIKRQGPGGRTVAGNALLICTKDGGRDKSDQSLAPSATPGVADRL